MFMDGKSPAQAGLLLCAEVCARGSLQAFGARGDDTHPHRHSCYSALNFFPRISKVLAELRLENYAVIDNVAVEFAPGLNLLTGETGSGKSILIDALSLLLGDKASAEVIRSGAERAVISAVFEVEAGAEKLVAQILETNGIDNENDSVILRREIASAAKGGYS